MRFFFDTDCECPGSTDLPWFRAKPMPASFLLFVGLVAFCGGCRQQATQPGTVVGSSMAPTFVGSHWTANCDDCSYRFRFANGEGSGWPVNVVCPNCGHVGIAMENADQQSPQKVQIRPAEKLSRWDVVAFQLPDGVQQGIKRIVGLPSENVEVRHGDLFVDGSILRKPLSVQKQLRIPVYDSKYWPASTEKQRLRPVAMPTGWKRTNSQWHFHPFEANRAPDLDWLKYHHWRCFSQNGERDQDFPVEDSYGFNQALARNLHKTDDLFFELNFSVESDSIVGWRYYRGTTCHEFLINPKNRRLQWFVSSGEDLVEPYVVPLGKMNPDHVNIEFSSFDAQVIVAVNGQTVLDRSGSPSYPPVATYPLEIGGGGKGIQIRRLRIWRDVFYFPVSADRAQLRGEPDGYLMLGDNVPMSWDSRHWRQGAIGRDEIIGVVLGESGQQH